MDGNGFSGKARLFPDPAEARAAFADAQGAVTSARLLYDQATTCNAEVAAFRATLLREAAESLCEAARVLERTASLAARARS